MSHAGSLDELTDAAEAAGAFDNLAEATIGVQAFNIANAEDGDAFALAIHRAIDSLADDLRRSGIAATVGGAGYLINV